MKIIKRKKERDKFVLEKVEFLLSFFLTCSLATFLCMYFFKSFISKVWLVFLTK